MKIYKSAFIPLIGVAALLFGAPTMASKKPLELSANVGYVNLHHLPTGDGTVNPIRLKALQETASQLGAQGALAWRSLQINRSLEFAASHLDHVFDFNKMLIDNDVLPPVITEANDSLTVDDDATIRLAAKTYRIVSPARFVTAAPTWRGYLWMNFQKPTLPSQTLLPTTKAEARIWNAYLEQGWKEGLTQANTIFRENLDLLKRDYQGMILYNQLLQQHIVSKPYIAKADLGVTGDGNQIRINDQVLRITAASQLQPNSNQWTPVVTTGADEK